MEDGSERAVPIPVDKPIWSRFFTVSPLVIIGTVEGDGFDLAPKHMAMQLGWENWFCFVCSPRHATQGNAERTGAFTVSFPRPDGILAASLAASPRTDDHAKPALAGVETFPARVVEGVLVADSNLWLECELERIVAGFGTNTLVVGRIVAAAAAPAALRAADDDDADLIFNQPLLAYLSPGRFARVSDSLSFPWHVNMRI